MDAPVNGPGAGGRGAHLDGRLGGVAVLGAEVLLIRLEHPDDGGGGAEADVEILECVVVDQIELDVLVPTALAGARVGLPEQVKLDSLVRLRLRLAGVSGVRFPRFFGGGSGFTTGLFLRFLRRAGEQAGNDQKSGQPGGRKKAKQPGRGNGKETMHSY